jgi:hypothetical protein
MKKWKNTMVVPSDCFQMTHGRHSMVHSLTKKCSPEDGTHISLTLQIVKSSCLSHGRDGSPMHLVGMVGMT